MLQKRYWKEAQVPVNKKAKTVWVAYVQSPLPEPNPHGLYFTRRGLGYFATPEAADEAIERDKQGLSTFGLQA